MESCNGNLPSLKLLAKARENWWLDDEFLFGMADFQGLLLLVSGRVNQKKKWKIYRAQLFVGGMKLHFQDTWILFVSDDFLRIRSRGKSVEPILVSMQILQ